MFSLTAGNYRHTSVYADVRPRYSNLYPNTENANVHGAVNTCANAYCPFDVTVSTSAVLTVFL